jgi:hypothetical protein
MNATSTPSTRKIKVTVTDGPLSLKAAVDQIAQATAVPRAVQADAVAAARKSLEPVVQKANALVKEISDLAGQHEDNIRALASTNWPALRRFHVPEPTLARLHRLVSEARDAMANGRANLAEIPRRVRDLTADDLALRVYEAKSWRPEGQYPLGAANITADVEVQAGIPARIRELVSQIEVLVAEVQRFVERAGGSLADVRAIKIDEDEARGTSRVYGAADTAYNPLDR